MQVTYIGLSEYFQRCIPNAKKKGYLLVISLIARYSDAEDLYERLEKDWASLNNLTGDKILFLFSTPEVREKASFFHMIGKEPYEGVMCPYIELLDGKGVEDENGPFEYLYGNYGQIDWKQKHSQTITEFAADYNIPEKDIPCLFLYDLIGDRYKVIPVGQSTDIYAMIKALVGAMAEKGDTRQCLAIKKVLQDEQAYKEVNDDENRERYLELKRKQDEYENELNSKWENLEDIMGKSKKGKNTEETVLQDLLAACVKLQSNHTYSKISEDQRNDYIRDMLKMAKYEVQDQTRRGTSPAGKRAGEVDILIERGGLPVTIIEALNLDSFHFSKEGCDICETNN